MAKMLYSATMSLDGFITGPGGDMSWLTPYLGPDPMADRLVGRVGAILAGRRSFGGDDPHRGDPEREGKAFGGGWDGPQFVLTHRPPSAPVPGVTFVGDLRTAVAEARRAAGDRYVNVIGADVARQCLAAGMLDEPRRPPACTTASPARSSAGSGRSSARRTRRPSPCPGSRRSRRTTARRPPACG
ncbi:dihydrofolate reductase family protein [Nonomuraea sp. NPDC023979]|uniref:dihydrofolate reductase family protein n=1 Tax=Nonomuraea sp. NPDC023979 TaxID=3154796 RepID=UPI0033F8C257